MWRLLPIALLRLASAFPTNWNGTTTCPQDALYTSLIGDSGKFCSSVLEGSHCGTRYSTPPEYMRYNQTQISSYCECILTDSGAVTTSANSSRESTGDITVTTADSASQTGSQSVSETQSEMGGPGGPSDSTSTATTEGPRSTPTSFSNRTDPASSLGEATGSGTSAATSNESQSVTTDSRNATTGSALSSFGGSPSGSTWTTTTGTPTPGSWNQTRSVVSSEEPSGQVASNSTSMTTTGTPGPMTSGSWNNTLLPWSSSGETASQSPSNTKPDDSRPTTSVSWNSTWPALPSSGEATGGSPWNTPTDGLTPTASGTWNETRSASSSINRPWTRPAPGNSTRSSTIRATPTGGSWNTTDPRTPMPTTPGTVSSFSQVVNNTWSTWPLSPTTDVTSDLNEPGMTRSWSTRSTWNTSSSGLLPWPVPGTPTSGSGGGVSLPTVAPTSTFVGWNSSVSLPTISWNASISLPTINSSISLPTISWPSGTLPFPSLPFPIPPLPTLSDFIPSQTPSGSVAPSGDTTSSASGSIDSVTAPTSPTPTSAPSGSFNETVSRWGNATTTGASEFPAVHYTHVTRTAALSQETCHTLGPDPEGDATGRALLYNSRLREENVSIPIPYIESVEFESEGLNPLYLTVRDEQGGTYFVDISRRGQLSVFDPSGNSMSLDAVGIHFSGPNCTYHITIEIKDMYEQIADLAGVQCAAIKRKRRMEDMDFKQVLYLKDQCGNPVDKSLKQYPQLLVGGTVCADIDVDEEIGRWEFDCAFPGSESGFLRCQQAIKEDVLDVITVDPFGGSCPDLSTVVTTLDATAQDILDPDVLRKDLGNEGLTERQVQEADAAVVAYTKLWTALRAFFSKQLTFSSYGALETYVNVYNTYRSFETDICQSLHVDEIPFDLSLIAGATRIPSITSLSWAPTRARPYNITIQDPTRMACCPGGRVAETKDGTCAYPREAIIEGTGCICGKNSEGLGVAFEWTECGNFVASCELDGDCDDGFMCLTGSCCGGGVCVDAFACSQNGTELVKFDGVI
ncbi:Hypothetical protein NCS54_00643500 [Fusarium falciforme]|uniref:Hypothetical protein n=1 Tax=Fusarium falciforme TaxID=195108 RepID=UPI0022FFC773|nr:Hypothetical protein NCS54_00643500 [Fusarium falciforme]WAO89060.1 Hypothetical protein NCS54_00643500 [Fusarium falciforme]